MILSKFQEDLWAAVYVAAIRAGSDGLPARTKADWALHNFNTISLRFTPHGRLEP